MKIDNVAWALLACSLAFVALPTCDLIPLAWFIKPIGALLSALAFVLAVMDRPTLLVSVVRDGYNRILCAFIGIALLATLLGIAAGLPTLKGSTAEGSALKAFASLVIGLSTWLGLRSLVRNPQELILAERWLWGGLALSVAMALVQTAASLHVPGCQPVVEWVARHFAGSMMLDGRTPGRAWGLSPEPSLLGSQLAVAGMVPALVRLFAPSPSDGSRWIPWIALTICCLGLGLSRARTGLGLAIVLMPASFALAWWFRTGGGRLWHTSAGVSLLLCGMLALASLNPHLRSTTSGALNGATPASRAAAGGMASRLGAWSAGVATARAHPVLGVGLGLAPWGVVEHLPEWSLRDNAETQEWISPTPGPLPNIKHLWIRLAAETGVLGLLAFLAFLAWVAWPRRSDQPATKLIAVLAGLAVIGDGFSLDSFALPTMWTVLALVAARRQAQADPEPCAAS